MLTPPVPATAVSSGERTRAVGDRDLHHGDPGADLRLGGEARGARCFAAAKVALDLRRVALGDAGRAGPRSRRT